LLYTGKGQFGIILKDRYGVVIDPPTFEPPMKLRLEKLNIGTDFVAGLPEDTDILSYAHEIGFHDITLEKKINFL
jgi:hypothetical protein